MKAWRLLNGLQSGYKVAKTYPNITILQPFCRSPSIGFLSPWPPDCCHFARIFAFVLLPEIQAQVHGPRDSFPSPRLFCSYFRMMSSTGRSSHLFRSAPVLPCSVWSAHAVSLIHRQDTFNSWLYISWRLGYSGLPPRLWNKIKQPRTLHQPSLFPPYNISSGKRWRWGQIPRSLLAWHRVCIMSFRKPSLYGNSVKIREKRPSSRKMSTSWSGKQRAGWFLCS